MSEENVEVCKRALEAFAVHRDTEAGLVYTASEVVLRSAIIGGAEGNIYRGHDGIREWMAETDGAFRDLQFEFGEFRDLGDTVLIIGRMQARGRESGVEVDSEMAWLFTFRGDKIANVRGYLNPQDALEAVGLSE